jgi:type I restriction enzyme S subunit
MAGEWSQQPLEDVAELSGGFAFKSDDYSSNGRFVLRTLNIKDDGSIHRDDAVFLPEEKCHLYERFELQEHDTLFVMVGATLGKVGYVRREALPALLNQNMWRIRGRDGLCDKRYLQYAFRHTVVKNLGWASGSARDFVRRDDYRTMKIPVPPLAEQKAIAAVLGVLDDKIELNRRMNETLEAMARALFQSWFVDFDPVRAKLEGRKLSGPDEARAALFPNSFQDSALGHIPKGWEVKTLGKVVKLAYGKPLKAEDRKNGSVRVYGANGPVGWHEERFVAGPGIVVGRKGNPGVVTWAHCDFYPIDTTFYVEPIGACRSLYFLYYALSLQNLANLSADSAVPGLNRNYVYMCKQVIPPQDVLAVFDSQIKPIYESIHANEEQSRTLAGLRDTLLPRLLNRKVNLAKTAEA